MESKKAFKVLRHFSDQQSINRMHTTHHILSYRVVHTQTYCLHISMEVAQNGVSYYLLSWLFQSVPQRAALERIAKQREMRKGQLRQIRIKNHINPEQTLLATSVNLLIVIDPEKKTKCGKH